jgi:crotonobetainyl-CoA:carnitine CoA-transferase CaiB-like acyl-CoA transferase
MTDAIQPDLPLSGLMVLDFTTLLPGPLATLMMAEAGARVIKVEKIDGDPMRKWGAMWGRDSALFSMLNRGKKSIRLDLKDASQLEHLMPLIRRADILVEQFRPGVMVRLGLGYEAVAAINPSIIYCSITGFGKTGPRAKEPAHDLSLQAVTGLLSLSCGTADHPSMPPFLAADLDGGAWPAFANVLLALMRREKTGKGAHLDISMSDGLFTAQAWAIAEGLVKDAWPKSGEGEITGASPRYRLYATKDARMVAVAAMEDKFWKALCEITGLPDKLRDDSKNPQQTIEKLSEIFSSKDSEHWRKAFDKTPCCCAVVASLEEAMKDIHFHERGVFDHSVENDEGDVLPAHPLPISPQFRRPPQLAPLTAPPLGAHNDELLK